MEQSLSFVAKKHGVSPSFIYNLLRLKLEKEGSKSIPLTGLGKKTIKEVALTLNLSNEEFIGKLKAIGLEAKEEYEIVCIQLKKGIKLLKKLNEEK